MFQDDRDARSGNANPSKEDIGYQFAGAPTFHGLMCEAHGHSPELNVSSPVPVPEDIVLVVNT